jgi:flavin reductase (DIM6/NTAB) family NADH-FMN oxidoreductase RutF
MNAVAIPQETGEFDRRDLRNALGAFGTGVTVITTKDDEGRLYGVTASSFNSVSLSPPLVLWSQSRSAPSHAVFRNAPRFAVNILAADQTDLSERFSRPSVDKFAGVDFSFTDVGMPLLSGTAGHFICSNENQIDGGDHVIYLARVLAYCHDVAARPLFFWKGRYLQPELPITSQ